MSAFMRPSQVHDWAVESAMIDNDPNRLEPPVTFDDVYPEEYLAQLMREAANQPTIQPDEIIEDPCYESFANAGDHVEDVLSVVAKQACGLATEGPEYVPQGDLPWFQPKPMDDAETFRGIEMIVDGFLASGHNSLAGKRGAGKTSTLVPFLLAIAGLIPSYSLRIPVRRIVYLITEDYRQVLQMVRGYKRHGLITASWDEINHWFRVSNSERITAEEIVAHGPELEKCWTPFERPNGEPIRCYPLVVLDTVLANIRSENSNDNDSVANDVTEIREAFANVNLLLVGHTPKNGSDGELTMLGAQAWEGLIQGSLVLDKSGTGKNTKLTVKITKPRFEPTHWEFPVSSMVIEIDDAEDFYGNPTVELVRYNEIREPSEEDGADVGVDSETDLIAKVYAAIRDYPNSSGNKIKEKVGKNAQAVGQAIKHLREEKRIQNNGIKDSPKWAITEEVADDLPPELN